MKHNLLIVVLCLFGITHSQNCKHTFIGEVIDFHDGNPLSGATIHIQSLDKFTTTGINGKFSINNLCNGKIVLVISHIGCETKRIEVDIIGDSYQKILMEHHTEELDEVSVTSNGAKKTTVTAQESIIKSKILLQYSSQSLGDALREVPGVSSINTGSTIVKPIINGMHSSRVLILNNGVRLQDQEWGIEHAPNIDINSAGQISVIKGSGALAYGGDAIGGVVVVNPIRNIRKDTLYGHTILSGQSNGRGYNVSSNLNKNYKSGWFAQAQGSYKRNGDFMAADYNLTNTGAESTGFSARFGKNKFESGFEAFYSYIDNEIGILRSAHIGSIKSLANSINAARPLFVEDFSYKISEPKQKVSHHLAKTTYYKRFKNFGKLDFQYDYQNNHRFEFDIRRGGRSSKAAIDLELQTHTLSLNAKKDNNLDRKYNFGLLVRYQDHFANPDTGVRRLIPDYDKYDFGGYITTEWRIHNNVLADAGLRYDFSRIDAKKFYRTATWEERGYDVEFPELVIEELRNQVLTDPTFDYHNISGALGIRYNINANNYILGNYALASRAPNPSELFSDGLHHSAARIEVGDLRIDSERSHRISTSYAYSGSKLDFQLETYYNQINNFIYIVPSPLGIVPLIRGPFPIWEYVQTDAWFFGIDVNANYEITPSWDVNHKSAFIKAYDKQDDIPLIDIPPFTTYNSITYTNARWSNFKTSLRSEWAFEQNEFPLDFNYTVPIADEDDIDVDLSPPLAYHLMHFQSEITLPLFKKSSLNIRFSVDNIFNTSYRNYLNRLRFFADDLGRNFRLQLQLNY